MALPPHYSNIVYPNNIDFFLEVSNGNNPANIIDAGLVNKISNALRAVEQHTQYTCDTPTATGNYVLLDQKTVQLTSDLADPGLLLGITFAVNSTLAAQNFSNNPFSRNNAIFVNGVGYKIISGVRSYYPTRAAVNIRQENGNLTLTINCIKTTKWRAGDVCEANVMIARIP